MWAYPTTFVVDKHGIIVMRVLLRISKDEKAVEEVFQKNKLLVEK